MGVTATGAEEKIDLWIHTWSEEKKKIEGTEELRFDVYDLTEWREKRNGDEKEDKEFILNSYPSKEKLLNFVEQEQLRKVNETPYEVDGNGNVSFDVPRYQSGKDAAYLILSDGETGPHHMLPIIIYLPQLYPETKEEASRLLIYGKFKDTTKEPTQPSEPTPPDEPKTPDEPEYRGPEKSNTSTGKQYPSTNDLVRNYMGVGLLLILLGLLGFKKIQKKK